MTRILLIAGLLVGLGRGTAEASILLQHSFHTVYDSNAEDFLYSTSNAVKRAEGNGTKYWSPSANGVDAEIVYRFNAGAKIDQAVLYARVNQFDFGSSWGVADIWGSRNGQDWTWLAGNNQTRGDGTFRYGTGEDIPDALPSNLLGGNEIWIKATMNTVGSPIMAQWARNPYWIPEANVFEIQLHSNPVPEPATIAVWSILGLCGVGYGLRRKMMRSV